MINHVVGLKDRTHTYRDIDIYNASRTGQYIALAVMFVIVEVALFTLLFLDKVLKFAVKLYVKAKDRKKKKQKEKREQQNQKPTP